MFAYTTTLRTPSMMPAFTLDEQRKNGLREPNGADAPDIKTIVAISEEVTSQLRHSLLLQGDPPSGKLLIPQLPLTTCSSV